MFFFVEMAVYIPGYQIIWKKDFLITKMAKEENIPDRTNQCS